MARETLPLLAHLPRLEADGVTHRRDCECVRCDAGFRPTEHDRTVARERWQLAKAQQAASRALDRRREKVRAKKFALVMELDADARATDEHITALRAARTRADSDDRLAMLQRLRSEGVPLAEALDRGGSNRSRGPSRDRTCDQRIKSPLLYQLSYRPGTKRGEISLRDTGAATGTMTGDAIRDRSRSSGLAWR